MHSFNFQEPRHYAPQCPHKHKGKQPAVNIITADVQQVTTRSKAKTAEWEELDGIRKAAQEWVTKDNATNVERMRRESIWEALVDCRITLTMSKLLNLVPRFPQAMEARLQAPHQAIPAMLTETNPGA